MVLPPLPDTEPIFPPPFEPIAVGSADAFRRALDEAARGSGAGTLVWAQRRDRLDLAVVLEPEMPLAHAWPAALVAMLATADALGSLGPPEKPITFAWPDRVEVDGAQVGGVLAAASPGASADGVPDWLVIGVKLRMRFPDDFDAPGRQPDRTALFEEGFADADAPTLAASIARHFLYWTSQWLDAGFEPVARHWLAHLPAPMQGGAAKNGLDPATGDLLVLKPGQTEPERHALAAALATPSWTL